MSEARPFAVSYRRERFFSSAFMTTQSKSLSMAVCRLAIADLAESGRRFARRSCLVRVLNGLANLDEQFETVFNGNIVLAAKFRDLDAADQFHDEVRAARFSGAGIQHLGNVRMVHERQGLALGLEAGNDLPGVHAEL